MSATGEIQAAIDKLTHFRDRSAPGPWTSGQRVVWDANVETVAETSGWGPNPNQVGLIVILHSTINAQLALLELAMEYGELPVNSGSRFSESALSLARAINES